MGGLVGHGTHNGCGCGCGCGGGGAALGKRDEVSSGEGTSDEKSEKRSAGCGDGGYGSYGGAGYGTGCGTGCGTGYGTGTGYGAGYGTTGAGVTGGSVSHVATTGLNDGFG